MRQILQNKTHAFLAILLFSILTLGIPATFAIYNNKQVIRGNSVETGTLSVIPDVLEINLGKKKPGFLLIKNDGDMPAQFSFQDFEFAQVCNTLLLKYQIKSNKGKLSEFTPMTISPGQSFKMKITVDNKKDTAADCKIRLTLIAWQTNFEKPTEGGFTDSHILSLLATSNKDDEDEHDDNDDSSEHEHQTPTPTPTVTTTASPSASVSPSISPSPSPTPTPSPSPTLPTITAPDNQNAE